MVPEKGATGDFDYLREAADGSDGVDVVEQENSYASETDLDYLLASDRSQTADRFDAFDENTWDEDFSPVATAPWYRSPQSRTLLLASAAALSAIVISVSLLVFRSPSVGNDDTPVQHATTAVTTPLATATSEKPVPPPPPPPPPPAPPPEPSTVNEGPAAPRPTLRPRQTNKPEIGVTRTPVTRSPISVAPQPRGPRN